MNQSTSVIKASVRAGCDWLRSPPFAVDSPRSDPAMVPIRALGENDRAAIAAHLRALDPHDRYLRFGLAMRDEQLQTYVEGIDFGRDDVFGIFNRHLRLVAMAHLARAADAEMLACAEFGVSVDATYRGRGYGDLLFARAITHGRNHGVQLLFIHALSENAAMLHMARKAGALLEREGSETEAYLRLPPATLDTQVSEMLEEQVGRTDYLLKAQAKAFWDFLRTVQEIRRGVQDGRHRASP
ncbi:MAG: GNAT family N-acetyltransferase [Betaproteobacteria bacterium]|nr:GNAT family N-acetyltransferase [Betaproteobacteria bacterium]